MLRTQWRMLAFAVVVSVARSAYAVPVTFEFSGIVNSVTDPGRDLEGLVAAGNTFSGEYTFESTTPGYGYYVSPAGSVSLTVGSLQIDAGPPRIMVWDAEPPYSDEYSVSAASDSIVASGLQIVEFLPIIFHYANHTSLTSGDLSLVPPPLPFNSSSWSFWIQGRGSSEQLFTLRGTVESLTPEPCTPLLLLMGITLSVRRRKMRS